jgi:hypothetical protein
MIPSVFILLSWNNPILINERIIIIIFLSMLLIIIFWNIISTRNQFIILGIERGLLIQNIENELSKRKYSNSNVINNEKILEHFKIVPFLFTAGIILVIDKGIASRKEKSEIISLVKKSFNEVKMNNAGRRVIFLIIIFLITFAYIFIR